jgi:hypothetical protein
MIVSNIVRFLVLETIIIIYISAIGGYSFYSQVEYIFNKRKFHFGIICFHINTFF